MTAFFPKILITLGILILSLAGYEFRQRTVPQNLAFNLSQPLSIASQSSNLKPTGILIKDLNINLKVYPAKITGKRWESTEKGVSYLASSPPPGEKGNSIFSGHNWQNLLGNLTHAKPGDKIQILFENNSVKTFIVQKTSVVSPDQTSVLDPSEDRRITLYTCTGLFDSKRFVVTALLKED